MPTVVRFPNGTAVLYPERLFNQNGAVGTWTRQIAKESEEEVQGEAPSRTGALRASVSASDNRAGPTSRTISIRVGAEHARFVLGGTSSGGVGSLVGGDSPYGSGYPGTVSGFKSSSRWAGTLFTRNTYVRGVVKGQEANDFVARGITNVAARHPALAGFRVTQVGS